MSEELNLENQNQDTDIGESKPELSEVEKKAAEQGWRPKEEWDGEPEQWRSATEFLDRGEFIQRISSQSGEIKELRKALNYLVDHHKKVKETEFDRALEHLKTMKKEALQEGDPDKVVEVDEAISEIKEKAKEAKAVSNRPMASQPSQNFVQFVKENGWYTTDQEMRQFADEIGVGYFNRNPGTQELDLYGYVLKRVKQTFPDKFKEKSKSPSVEGSPSTGGTSKGGYEKDYALTEDERRVMNTFVKQGIMSKADYIKELKRVKGD